MKKGQFDILYENAGQNFAHGGFMVGELVRLKAGAELSDYIKSSNHPKFQETLKEWLKNKDLLIVQALHPVRYFQDNIGTDKPHHIMVGVTKQISPGLGGNDIVPVPAGCLEVVSAWDKAMEVKNMIPRYHRVTNNSDEHPARADKFADAYNTGKQPEPVQKPSTQAPTHRGGRKKK